MDLTLLARLAAVGATLLAVVVALLKEQLQSLFWKPEFKVQIETRPPFCIKTQSSVTGTGLDGTTRLLWSGSIYWARLWVENKGTRRAESVEVFVTKVQHLNRDHSSTPVEGFVPSNLRWANTTPSNPEIFYGINPEMGRYCDLGSVADPACTTLREIRGVPRGTATFDLVLQSPPPGDAHRLPPGDYRITFKISAANAKPVERTVELSISGHWTEDEKAMLGRELGVSIAP